jgi:hypothetical protein
VVLGVGAHRGLAGESELRQSRAFHAEEITRLREQGRDDLRDRTRGHERELKAVEDSARAQIDSIKISYEARIDGLKHEVSRLMSDLDAAKKEVAELRSKKDKSLTEQAKEIVSVQEAFKSLGVGGTGKDEDDDSDKPWYERMATRVMENPGAIGELIGGVRQNVAPSPTAPTEQPQLPPPGQPFQAPDGQVYVQRPDGKVQRLSPAAGRALAAGISPAVRKKAAAAKAAVEGGAVAPRPPDAMELTMAVKFMEAASSNGTKPEDFAATARTAISADILAYVEKAGVDEILNAANLDPTSPLRTQAGRNWARAVARILLEGA